MIRKYFVLFFSCLLFSCAVLSSCENAVNSEVPSEDKDIGTKKRNREDVNITKARIALARDWSMYLLSVENSLKNMLWALEYAETAVDSCDWRDIQRALTAVEAAIIHIDAQTPFEQELTEEMYKLLSSRYGDDVYMVILERADEEELLNGIKDYMRVLRYNLSDRLFLNSDINTIKEEVKYQKKYCYDLLKYYAYATAYLMELIPDSKEVIKTDIQKFHPLIYERMPKNDIDQERLEAMGAVELNNIEEHNKKQAKLLAIVQNDIIIYNEAYRKKDVTMLKSDSTQINGAEDYLPAPLWYSDGSAKILWLLKKEEDDKGSIPDTGQEIGDKVPSELDIACDGVSKEDILLFLTQLKEKGIDYCERKEDDSENYKFTGDKWSVDIKSKGESVTMIVKGKIPCFVPFWYKAL